MITPAKLMMGLAAAAVLSTPGLAQPTRTGQVANEIARGIRDTAEAIGTVSDALYQGVNGIRYRGAERYAIDVCRPRVERYGAMRVESVQPYGRRSFRVYGTADSRLGYYERSSWSRGYSPRSFTCTVRDDGRVKVKTKRLRY